ncbi:hypothetical protein BBF96_08600 [Anoxybacter fermentans]|uniref:Uncharacterized protein n=1 Tax=Anoxybacter fermentans TaxID=1323375 RepID=A0A3Q9HR48_9FIRM|nr:hypothetical protein [Anoxybacter fermentans]AZR73435.1 hypothetical protein BBF96_08600 [Anoxybacter fermentans]
MVKQFANNPNKKWVKTLQVGYNASGAAAAALKGDVVIIVDVIDMSTTAEAVLDAGAVLVLGAAPDDVIPPVAVNPEKMGYLAGCMALQHKTDLIVIAEPRWETEEERKKRIQSALAGINRSGVKLTHILPNIGGEVSKLAEFKDKVVLIVSDTGGVAFDAAYIHGAPEVLTATVSRTRAKKGLAPAEAAVKRAIEAANQHRTGITFVAATSNSLEDILAAEYLARKVIETGFLNR